MPLSTLLLYCLFVIASICTIHMLTKYKMRVARIAYIFASLISMLYLPIYAGNELMSKFLSSVLCSFSCEPVIDALREPLAVSTPYITGSFAIGIVISIFICLSTVSVALTAINVYRNFCKKCKAHHGDFSHSPKKLYIDIRAAFLPKNFCATFCRYNC